MNKRNTIALAALCSLFALTEKVIADDFFDMPLEQVLDINVTSVSKRPQKVSKAAASIFVLTPEDIRRSGATSIPEVLRLVPGVHVARINTSEWAISIRGFNGIYADKLLVLVDGRTVYSPTTAGVWWDEPDVVMQDIARIEVIRGPGATLWGANAVNGVINVITKSSADTQGTLVNVGGGSEERSFGTVRYGGKQEDTNYRVYAKAFERDNSRLVSGGGSFDSWQSVQTGFRTDTQLTEKDDLTVQADTRYSERGWDINVPSITQISESRDEKKYLTNTNLLARWNHTESADTSSSLQFFYENLERNDSVFEIDRDLYDLDYQYRTVVAEDHELIAGAGYRGYEDTIPGSLGITLEPETRQVNLYTFFLQDNISLIKDELTLTIGSKFERSEWDGFSVQPNIRTLWSVTEATSLWAAVSRADRAPNRFNNDGRLVAAVIPDQAPLPLAVTLNGDDGYEDETALTYEVGYRSELSKELTVDMSVFFTRYDSLASAEPSGEPFVNSYEGDAFIEVPYVLDNKLDGQAYGAEMSADWRPKDWLRFVAGYAFHHTDIWHTQSSLDEIFLDTPNQNSEHQASLRSLVTLPGNVEWDSMLRYVDSVPSYDIDAYIELDTRVAWRVTPHVEIAIVGQNLLDSSHSEYRANFVPSEPIAVQRGVYGEVTWKF